MKKVSEKRYVVKHAESGYDKKLLVKQFELPNGMTDTFILDEGKDSVQIFAMTENGYVICVQQFRPAYEKEELELPGGGMSAEDEGDHATAAYRELLEESGHEGELSYLASIPYSPYSLGRRHCYVATGCRKVAKLDLDPNEFLKVILIPLEEFREEKMKKGQVRGVDACYMALDRLGILR